MLMALTKWIKYFMHIKVILTPSMIICNNYNGLYKDTINCIILVSKQFIYAYKCRKKMLNQVLMISRIYETGRIECNIATKKG